MVTLFRWSQVFLMYFYDLYFKTGRSVWPVSEGRTAGMPTDCIDEAMSHCYVRQIGSTFDVRYSMNIENSNIGKQRFIWIHMHTDFSCFRRRPCDATNIDLCQLPVSGWRFDKRNTANVNGENSVSLKIRRDIANVNVSSRSINQST